MVQGDLNIPLIKGRVLDSRFGKSFKPQETGIAFPTGLPFRRGIITGAGQAEINPQFQTLSNNLGLIPVSYTHLTLPTILLV